MGDQQMEVVPADAGALQGLGDTSPEFAQARQLLSTTMRNHKLVPVALGTALGALPERRSARIKRGRRVAEAQKRGRTDIKLPTANQTTGLKDFMGRLGRIRGEFIKNYTNKSLVFDKLATAEEGWKNTILTANDPLLLGAFGVDAGGIEKRRRIATGGFQTTGGVGHFKPYYVSGGVIRGGMRGKGVQGIAPGGRQIYSIPTQPNGDTRQLVSMQAKYVDPMKFPSTRIIKYLRGHWGQNAGVSKYETIW